MEDKMLKLCKRVIENKGYINSFGDDCKGVECYNDNCIFNGFEKVCSELPKECLKIAQEYIDKHEPKTKRNDNMEKTFRKVIRDIKQDEVWECRNFIIYLDDLNNVNIDSKNGGFIESAGIVFDGMLTLQRKKYDFIEAFKAYEEGKEIESCESGKVFYKSSLGVQVMFNLFYEEIKGNWYINI